MTSGSKQHSSVFANDLVWNFRAFLPGDAAANGCVKQNWLAYFTSLGQKKNGRFASWPRLPGIPGSLASLHSRDSPVFIDQLIDLDRKAVFKTRVKNVEVERVALFEICAKVVERKVIECP